MPKREPNEALMKAWGERLREARIVAGYETAEDLAAEVPVEGPRYRRYERGETLPPLNILIHISELLDKPLDWLLAGKGERRRTSSGRSRSPRSVQDAVVPSKVDRKINGAASTAGAPSKDHSRFIHSLGGPKKVAQFIREKTGDEITQQGVSQ